MLAWVWKIRANTGIIAACVALAACATAPDRRVDALNLTALSADVDAGTFGDIASIIVSRDNTIVFEDYFGGSRPDHLVDMRSVGKSITALAVGTAISDGAIDGLDMPVLAQFLPQDEAARAETVDIVLEDLLLMRSAFDCDDWTDSPGNEERMYRTRDWTSFTLALPRDPGFTRGPDGIGRFRYCTAGAFLAAQIVERRTGQSFDKYVQERLFSPLGIDQVRWRRSPSSEVQGGGQMRFRARDIHRVGLLVLNRGRWNGEQIVDPMWLTRMLQPRTVKGADFSYGYLWWTRTLRVGASGQTVQAHLMTGNGGNIVAIIPELSAVIVVQARNYNAPGHYQTSAAMIQGYLLPALVAITPRNLDPRR